MEPSRSQDRDHRRSRRVRFGVAVLLVLAAVAWLPLQPFQGVTLFDLVPGLPLTEADLVSVALLLVARSIFLSRVGPRPRPVVARTAVTRAAVTRPARPTPSSPTPFRPVPARPAPLRPAHARP